MNMGILTVLMEVGQEIASIWGGYCKDAEIDYENKEVNFLCSEHGEEFYTPLSFFELERDYGVQV